MAANCESLSVLQVFRRYVTEFVNQHDFSVLPAIMTETYQLETGGLTIAGRDGPYRNAVARQLQQFPGLVFTPHELFHVGDRLAVRFTEHGTSLRHEGRAAAWTSIAIYGVADGRLSRCAIEQDYFARRQQLSSGVASLVDRPHVAPWDVAPSKNNAHAEKVVRNWLMSATYLSDDIVNVDGEKNEIPRIVQGSEVEVLEMLAGDDQVAFHAVHRGPLAGDFPTDQSIYSSESAFIHMSGMVRLRGSEICDGHIIRDRWGLYRRLGGMQQRRELEV